MVGSYVSDTLLAVQDAEFQVQSAIAVREQYKAKLQQLLDVLVPSGLKISSPVGLKASKTKTKATLRPTEGRDAIAERLRTRATLPQGKEMHVLGDWLLLLRAASVNVVESIQEWRHVVHQNRPAPYESTEVPSNYLLHMCNDVDFLNQCPDLVEWLGFRLVRNPFIIRDGLDPDVDNTVNTQVSTIALMSPQYRIKSTKQSQTSAPPAALVKPLISILPDDDVVDGTRIAYAQSILQQEEALYGRRELFINVTKYVEHRPTDAEKPILAGDTAKMATVYDEIAVVSRRLRVEKVKLSKEERNLDKVIQLRHGLAQQISLTTKHREQDMVKDHRVWRMQEQCRQETLRMVEAWDRALKQREDELRLAVGHCQEIVSKREKELQRLEQQQTEARQNRRDEKQQKVLKEAEKRRNLRQKTVARNQSIKVIRRRRRSESSLTETSNPLDIIEPLQSPGDDYAVDIVHPPASPVSDRRLELDAKRIENLERRDVLRLHRKRTQEEEDAEMERRRRENAQMWMEDARAKALERRWKRRIILKAEKERQQRIASIPLFSTMQELGGNNRKKFRVSVYPYRAKGYALDGLRIAAYDPATSNTFSLIMSQREYGSLGYGRTLEGFTAFCQWLCLIYEKRKRQFRLIWSGAPCPPPLRIKEYDQALVCVHKEGIRVYSSVYCLVAAYIRTSDPGVVRFVVFGGISGQEPSTWVEEFAVTASELVPTASIVNRTDPNGYQYAIWLHDAFQTHPFDESRPGTAISTVEHEAKRVRVFSGELMVEGKRHRAHIYDVSETECVLALSQSKETRAQAAETVLLKHDVNPYGVRLPHSAFGDLLSCLQLELDGESQCKVTILPRWRDRLAKFVRVLRMARFGCKIDGVFHLVTLVLVQQKTEFRAHLLLEMTRVGNHMTRHSLSIRLSEFLRCPDGFWRATKSNDSSHEDLECVECLDNRQALDAELHAHNDVTTLHESEYDVPEVCETCPSIQAHRIERVKELVTTATLSDEALQYLYYASCPSCDTLPQPIAIAVSSVVQGTNDLVENVLSHYFSCFNVGQLPTIAADVRHTLDHSRIIVLYDVPIGAMVDSALAFLEHLHWSLYPEEYEKMPLHVVMCIDDIVQRAIERDSHASVTTDVALHDGMRGLLDAITTIGSVHSSQDSDELLNFDAYLVSEALLVEATRVVMYPEHAWRMPGETIGASSWGTACEYLIKPQIFCQELQSRVLQSFGVTNLAILRGYEGHPKWPAQYEDLRPQFHALLNVMLHILHVHSVIEHGGGLLHQLAEASVQENSVTRLPSNVSIVRIAAV
ncbi:hypothetical protein Poli38472_013811 [Pythium oligandrum]|uniref:Uncharacterized protein n=1 Tax=Pythium oligandrum TaxID=41045 RepID=A0A8K1FBP8_PYTOL|nr:hypothetical protein Poli38472_013811 [Pythium oligandrum]|eukprot:TMW55049.1 hypothetical protein Poli38472_013811 [Pythium oligandrum]